MNHQCIHTRQSLYRHPLDSSNTTLDLINWLLLRKGAVVKVYLSSASIVAISAHGASRKTPFTVILKDVRGAQQDVRRVYHDISRDRRFSTPGQDRRYNVMNQTSRIPSGWCPFLIMDVSPHLSVLHSTTMQVLNLSHQLKHLSKDQKVLHFSVLPTLFQTKPTTPRNRGFLTVPHGRT